MQASDTLYTHKIQMGENIFLMKCLVQWRVSIQGTEELFIYAMACIDKDGILYWTHHEELWAYVGLFFVFGPCSREIPVHKAVKWRH